MVNGLVVGATQWYFASGRTKTNTRDGSSFGGQQNLQLRWRYLWALECRRAKGESRKPAVRNCRATSATQWRAWEALERKRELEVGDSNRGIITKNATISYVLLLDRDYKWVPEAPRNWNALDCVKDAWYVSKSRNSEVRLSTPPAGGRFAGCLWKTRG